MNKPETIRAKTKSFPKITLKTTEVQKDFALSDGRDISALKRRVKEELSAVSLLELSEIDDRKPFSELGLDSVLAVEFANRLKKAFGVELAATKLYDYPSVETFSAYLSSVSGLGSEEASPGNSSLPQDDGPVGVKKSDGERNTSKSNGRDISALKRRVKEELSAVSLLELSEIDDRKPFSELGLDSVLAVEFTNRLKKAFGVELAATKLYDYPSVEAFSGYLSSIPDLVSEEMSPINSSLPQDGGPVGVKKVEPSFSEIFSAKKARTGNPVLNVIRPVAKTGELRPAVKTSNNAAGSDIAVVGLSARFPGADNLDEFRRNLAAGVDSVREVPSERWNWREHYDPDPAAPYKTYCRRGGFLEDIDKFDPLFFNISPSDADLMDPQQRLFLECAWTALEDGGYSASSLNNVKCGVYAGVSGCDYQNGLIERKSGNPSSLLMGSSSAILPARIAYLLNLKGAALAIDTACSSSLVAVHLACESLIRGEADIMLVGGVSLASSANFYIMTSKAGMLSPSGRCKTFDNDADGFVPGEGVAVALLKPLEKAVADRDNIYGVIKASGMNQDGATNGITAPSAESQKKLELEVYESAGINPETITYVETHGTGTKLGDPIEIDALKQSFGRHSGNKRRCAIGSVKTNIGHTLAAAGLAGMIKTLLGLKYRKLFPSLHFKNINSHINLDDSPFYVNTRFKHWPSENGSPRRAAVSSFGFSGTNAHLLLEEHLTESSVPADSESPRLIVLSAKNEERLKAYAENFVRFLEETEEELSIADLAYTLQTGRGDMEERLALVTNSLDELAAALREYAENGRENSLIVGNIKKDKSKNALLIEDEEGAEFINSIIKKGKLAKLAQLWVGGIKIDWSLLRGDEKPQKISLPTYPFQKKRFWKPETADKNNAKAALHPLLDADISGAKEQAFEKELTGEEFFLADHRVSEEKVLPGAAHMEMIRAAGELIDETPARKLKNIIWIQPFKVNSHPRKIKVNLKPEKEKIAWRITELENGKETLYSQGELCSSADAESADFAPPAVKIEEIRKRCSRVRTGAELYRMFEKAGLNYGPAFQVIENLFSNETESLSELKLPEFLADGFGDFGLHPSLLDGALQTVMGISKSEQGVLLPFALKELKIIRPLEKKIYAHAVLRDGADSENKVFDIKLLNSSGEILAVVEQFKLRALTNEQTFKAEKTKALSGAEHKSKKTGEAKPEEPARRFSKDGKKTAREGINAADRLKDDLLRMVGSILKVDKDEIDPQDDISEYGFDSISFTELTNRLNKKFSLDLSPPEMFEHSTIDSLIGYLMEEHKTALLEFYSPISDSEFAAEDIIAEESLEDTLLLEPDFRVSAPEEEPNFRVSAPEEETGLSVSEGIAVIGMAARMPGADDLSQFWQNLIEGRDCVGEIPADRWDWRRHQSHDKNFTCSKWGGFLKDVDKFDAEFFNISPWEAELMDPQQRLFLEVVWHAVEDAGYSVSALSAKTGLFAGVSSNDYRELLKDRGIEPEAHTSTGNVNSVLANRVSYILNLKGPSESVDTACSSSLTALHRATRAIRSGECEMALVGGVNLMLIPDIHTSFSKAGMMSKNGRCKTFDRSADGYVRGEGAGALLLKPLEQAVRDGDGIKGVIKGTAVNHGGRVSSLTVPNPNAQSELIVKACLEAKVAPESVGYVECHGTGTSLGDPIEINGLKKAFKELYRRRGQESPETPRCGLGSVKTNIGHLEAAAGIAGIIKVLLSFEHEKLPAAVHFKEINPYIDLDKTPFYVVDENREWRPLKDASGKPFPLRAGVSSFGFGGSNAHVTLEKYQPYGEVPRTEMPPPYLIVLSAHNKDRLKDYVRKFVTFLEKHSNAENEKEELFLTNLAHTLQTGREAMEERLAITANSPEELLEKLKLYEETGRESDGLYLGVVEDKKQSKLLTGGEAGELFIKTILKNKELDRLAQLWANGAEIDWKPLYSDSVPRKISLPTYPFEKQRHWISEKAPVKFYGQDKTSAIHPMIDVNASTFHEYAFEKEFSGEEFYLKDHLVAGKKTLPGVAYMEMVRAIAERVGGNSTRKLKNLIWASPAVADSGNRKMKIILQPENDKTLWRAEDAVEKTLYSKGEFEFRDKEEKLDSPRLDLEAIRKRCPSVETGSECYQLFEKAGLNYGSSFQVIEKLMYNENEALARLKLPENLKPGFDGYGQRLVLMDGALQTTAGLLRKGGKNLFLPFSLKEVDIIKPLKEELYAYAVSNPESDDADKIFDIQLADSKGEVLTNLKGFGVRILQNGQSESEEESEEENLFFEPVWQIAEAEEKKDDFSGRALIFDWNGALAETFKEKYPEAAVVSVTPGDEYLKEESGRRIRISEEKDWQALMKSLTEEGFSPEVVVYSGFQPEKEKRNIENRLETSFHGLFYLTKALLKAGIKEKFRLFYVYQNGSEDSYFDQAVGGLAKTVNMEQFRLFQQTLGVDDPSDSRSVSAAIVRELQLSPRTAEVRYHEEQRLIRTPREFRPGDLKSERSLLKKRGVYLIAGGMGGLGMITAQYLAEKYQARLVLAGRSNLDPAAEEKLAELEKAGSEAIYVKADISRPEEAAKLIKEAKARFGALNGIIHGAGMIKDSLIINKTEAEIKAVPAPKIQGTLNLDRASKDENLDFMFLFSSMAGITGNAGQADYAYANAFMDAWAEKRRKLAEEGKRSGRAISVNWPYWSDGGMFLSQASLIWMEDALGITPLSAEQGLEFFERSLLLNKTQILTVRGIGAKLRNSLTLTSVPESLKEPREIPKSAETRSDKTLENLEKELIGMLSDLLKTDPEKFDVEADLGKYGADSIMLTNLVGQINAKWRIDAPIEGLLEQRSIASISRYLYRNHFQTASAESEKLNLAGEETPAGGSTGFASSDRLSAPEDAPDRGTDVKELSDSEIDKLLMDDLSMDPAFIDGLSDSELDKLLAASPESEKLNLAEEEKPAGGTDVEELSDLEIDKLLRDDLSMDPAFIDGLSDSELDKLLTA